MGSSFVVADARKIKNSLAGRGARAIGRPDDSDKGKTASKLERELLSSVAEGIRPFSEKGHEPRGITAEGRRGKLYFTWVGPITEGGGKKKTENRAGEARTVI